MAWPLLRAGALEDPATSDLDEHKMVGPWEFDPSCGWEECRSHAWRIRGKMDKNNRSLVMFYYPDSRPSLPEKVGHKELEKRSPHNTGVWKSRPYIV